MGVSIRRIILVPFRTGVVPRVWDDVRGVADGGRDVDPDVPDSMRRDDDDEKEEEDDMREGLLRW